MHADTRRPPVFFVSHGSPMATLEDDDYTQALAAWARATARPRAIAVVSAHWEAPHPTTEHFDPPFVALGATGGDRSVQDVYAGFRPRHPLAADVRPVGVRIA